MALRCVYVCLCLCVFIKLHITAQSGPVILVPPKGESMMTRHEGDTLYLQYSLLSFYYLDLLGRHRLNQYLLVFVFFVNVCVCGCLCG